MSWSGGEFSTESNYDYHFNKDHVCFTAASGDSGTGAQYPSVSPYVISVGGTDLTLSNNSYGSESAWSGSGGGVSSVEAKPDYQSTFYPSGTKRATPDVAYVAGSNSAVAVYDSYRQSGWIQVYGTSVGTPQWASLIAIANAGRSSTSALSCNSLTSSPFYSAASSNYANNYHDITTGSNGNSAGNGYDLVTGVGSPKADGLVPFLISQ
jgi:subtilase family serine protease